MRISDWTGAQDEDDLVASLIAAGIAAHVVQKARDCMDDPQLKHRSHFITTTHSTVGDVVLENSRFRLSKTPAVIERAGPDMGEHNVEVLTEILGYDMDKVADIFASLTME
jgi:crotonobetainyl-CoA:carnitine CoA-transferase CaiB-like acyl-CoA transferase